MEPIITPDPSNEPQDPISLSSQTNTIPFSTAIKNEAEETADTGITGSLLHYLHHDWTDNLDPGQYVAPKDIPQQFKSKYPNGTGQNILNIDIDAHDNKLMHDEQMASAPKGILADAGYVTTGIATGLVTDPVMDLATAGLGTVGEAGFKGVNTMYRLGTAGRAITRGVMGATEGIAVQTAQNAVGYEYDKDIGLNPDLNLTNGYGFASILGGAIHSTVGHLSDVSNKAKQAMMDTGLSQSVDGNVVDTSDIMNQALYNTAKTQFDHSANHGGKGKYTTPQTPRTYPWKEPIDLSESPYLKDIKFDTMEPETVESYKNAIQDQIDDVNSKLSNISADYDALSTVGVLDKAKNILQTPGLERSKSDMKYMNQINKMPHMGEMLSAMSENAANLTDSQKSLLTNLHDNPNYESTLVKQHLEDTQNAIDQVNSMLEKNKIKLDGTEKKQIIMGTGSLSKKATLVSALDSRKDFENTIDVLNNRQQQLRKVKQADKKYNKLYMQRNHLQNMHDALFAQQKVMEVPAMNAQDSNAIYWDMKNGKRQFGVDIGKAFEASDRSTLEANMNDEAYVRNRVQDMVDNKELPKKVMDDAEEENAKHDKNNRTFKKSVKDVVQCLFGAKE